MENKNIRNKIILIIIILFFIVIFLSAETGTDLIRDYNGLLRALIENESDLSNAEAGIKIINGTNGDSLYVVIDSLGNTKFISDSTFSFYKNLTKILKIADDGVTLSSGTNINEFSTDTNMSGNSDDAVPTEKAVKSYVKNYYTFGEIYRQTSMTIIIPNKDAWYEVNDFSRGNFSGITFNADYLTITESGYYQINGFVTVNSNCNGNKSTIAISINDVIVDKTKIEESLLGLEVLPLSGIINVSAEDKIKLEVMNENSKGNIVFKKCNIVFNKL